MGLSGYILLRGSHALACHAAFFCASFARSLGMSLRKLCGVLAALALALSQSQTR